MGDTMSPSPGRKVNPDGSVTYDFEGHVSAEGIDLDAASDESPPEDRKVRWLRQSDGAVVAEIFGHEDGTLRMSTVKSASFEGHVEAEGIDLPITELFGAETDSRVRWLHADGTPSGLEILAEETGGFYRMGIGYKPASEPGGGFNFYQRPDGKGAIVITADGEEGYLYDGADDRSIFLQLANTSLPGFAGSAKRRVSFGSLNVTGNGTRTRTVAIAHGLGLPVIYANVTVDGAFLWAKATSPMGGGVTFNAQITHLDGLGWSDTTTCRWIAIG